MDVSEVCVYLYSLEFFYLLMNALNVLSMCLIICALSMCFDHMCFEYVF